MHIVQLLTSITPLFTIFCCCWSHWSVPCTRRALTLFFLGLWQSVHVKKQTIFTHFSSPPSMFPAICPVLRNLSRSNINSSTESVQKLSQGRALSCWALSIHMRRSSFLCVFTPSWLTKIWIFWTDWTGTAACSCLPCPFCPFVLLSLRRDSSVCTLRLCFFFHCMILHF